MLSRIVVGLFSQMPPPKNALFERMVLRVILSVLSLKIPPPPLSVWLLSMTQSVIDNRPLLRIPPPDLPWRKPLRMVSPLILIVLNEPTERTRSIWLASIIVEAAPAPTILMTGLPLA